MQLFGKTPTSDGNEDRITFDLTAIPADVEQVVVAASRYDGARFGDLDDVRVTLADGTGEGLLRFSIEDAGAVGALLFGELYRRTGDWKFRAIGQGYESGLAGLAKDYGVDVDDDAAEGGAAAEQPEDGGFLRAPRRRRPSPSAGGALDRGSRYRRSQCPPGPVPVVEQIVSQPAEPKSAPRPRTAKKKVTLPRVAKKPLAENDSWRAARLFPVSALKSDRDGKIRATSVLLSVMAQVPEFGRRLTAGFGAPAGRMETFTEVSLPNGDSPEAA